MPEDVYTETQIELACKKLTITARPPRVYIRGPSETIYNSLSEAVIDSLRFYFSTNTTDTDPEFPGWFREDLEDF